MKQPLDKKQKFSSSQMTQVIIAVILLGIAALVVVALLALWFPKMLQRQPAQGASALPPTSVIPTLFIPTPDCGTPTLVLGSTTYQIQNLAPAPDGSLAVPSDTQGIAYWVEGTNTNYVFMLSPTQDNLALQTALTAGDLATIFGADCTTISFDVSAIETSQLIQPALFDQSIPGMTVFAQTDPSSAGFVVRGKLAEETVSVLDTPMPDESGILAEVSLLETSPSPDGTTIKVSISIRNYGQTAFTLSSSNVSLTPQDSAPLGLAGSEPSLPKKIGPGATETFHFTFPRPSAQIATLKIFTVEYDIEGY